MMDTSLDAQLLDTLIAADPDTMMAKQVRDLVAKGASVDARHAGMPALHWAARAGDVETVQALLELGADPNASATGSGDRPLHAALWVGATDEPAADIVRVLLAANASAAQPNIRGELPVHLAAENGYVRVIDVLAPHSPLATRANDGQSALERALIQSKFPAVERLLAHRAPVDEASLARVNHTGKPVRKLIERAVSGRPPVETAFDLFASILAQHMEDAAGVDERLSTSDVLVLLRRLAEALGESVGSALEQTDDADRFRDEYGDAWLGALLDSYWVDAYAGIARTAWEALPPAIRAELPDLEALLDDLRSRFEAAAEAAS